MTYKWVPGKTPAKADVSELFELICFMLRINPGSRPSAEKVMQHPWFACAKVLTGRVSGM
jgi:hypothetical protein